MTLAEKRAGLNDTVSGWVIGRVNVYFTSYMTLLKVQLEFLALNLVY